VTKSKNVVSARQAIFDRLEQEEAEMSHDLSADEQDQPGDQEPVAAAATRDKTESDDDSAAALAPPRRPSTAAPAAPKGSNKKGKSGVKADSALSNAWDACEYRDAVLSGAVSVVRARIPVLDGKDQHVEFLCVLEDHGRLFVCVSDLIHIGTPTPKPKNEQDFQKHFGKCVRYLLVLQSDTNGKPVKQVCRCVPLEVAPCLLDRMAKTVVGGNFSSKEKRGDIQRALNRVAAWALATKLGEKWADLYSDIELFERPLDIKDAELDSEFSGMTCSKSIVVPKPVEAVAVTSAAAPVKPKAKEKAKVVSKADDDAKADVKAKTAKVEAKAKAPVKVELKKKEQPVAPSASASAPVAKSKNKPVPDGAEVQAAPKRLKPDPAAALVIRAGPSVAVSSVADDDEAVLEAELAALEKEEAKIKADKEAEKKAKTKAGAKQVDEKVNMPKVTSTRKPAPATDAVDPVPAAPAAAPAPAPVPGALDRKHDGKMPRPLSPAPARVPDAVESVAEKPSAEPSVVEPVSEEPVQADDDAVVPGTQSTTPVAAADAPPPVEDTATELRNPGTPESEEDAPAAPPATP